MGITINLKKIYLPKVQKVTPLNTSSAMNIITSIDTNIMPVNDYVTNSDAEQFTFDEASRIQANTEQLSQMSTLLDSSIAGLESEIENLNTNKYTITGNSADSIQLVYNSSNTEHINNLNEQLSTLKYYRDQIQTQLSLAPYQEILTSSDYTNFIKNYNSENCIADVSGLIESGYDVNLYYMNHITSSADGSNTINNIDKLDQYAVFELMIKNNNNNANIEMLQAMGNACLMNGISPDGKNYSNPAENYYFMTEEQRGIYHYLFEVEGKQSAEEYISLIQDEINMKAGAYYADSFIQTLDMSDQGKLEESLRNFLFTGGKGFADGVDTFFTGLNNLIMADGKLEASDYEKLYILQYLQNNSNILDENYEFNSALGNMIPSMTASAIVSCVGTPVAGSMVGSTLMGLSAAGNATDQALVNSNDMFNSRIYGLLVGASEATLGYFLGRIPGISRTSSFAIQDLFMEGVEEFSQDWLDAGFRAVILGENIDWNKVPESSAKSFVMGIMMAGLLNGGQNIANFTLNGNHVQLNVQDVLNFLKSNPNVDIMDAIRQTNSDIPITNNTEVRETISSNISTEIDTLNLMKNEVEKSIQSGETLSDRYYELRSQLHNRVANVISEDVSMTELRDDLGYTIEELDRWRLDSLNTDSSVDTLVDNLFSYANESNPEGLLFFQKLRELQENGQLLIVTSTNAHEACYNSDFKFVDIGQEWIDYNAVSCLAHELGHLLHWQVLSYEIPSNFEDVVTIARQNAVESGKLDECSREYQNVINRIGEHAREDVNMTIKEKITEFLSLQRSYMEQGLSPTYAMKLAREELYDSRIAENIQSLLNGSTNKPFSPELSDIICSVFEGKKQTPDGKFITLTRGHDAEYLSSVDMQYAELIADFTSLKATGNAHDLQVIKEMFGDEFYNMLDETYHKMTMSQEYINSNSSELESGRVR